MTNAALFAVAQMQLPPLYTICSARTAGAGMNGAEMSPWNGMDTCVATMFTCSLQILAQAILVTHVQQTLCCYWKYNSGYCKQ